MAERVLRLSVRASFKFHVAKVFGWVFAGSMFVLYTVLMVYELTNEVAFISLPLCGAFAIGYAFASRHMRRNFQTLSMAAAVQNGNLSVQYANWVAGCMVLYFFAAFLFVKPAPFYAASDATEEAGRDRLANNIGGALISSAVALCTGSLAW